MLRRHFRVINAGLRREGGWLGHRRSLLAGGDPYVDALLNGEASFRRHATTTVLRLFYDGARPIMPAHSRLQKSQLALIHQPN